MNTLIQDLRYAVRMLSKNPGFAAVATLTLALGIGANTAIFSLVRELLFSPRPFPDEQQVVQFYTQDKKQPGRFRQFSYPTYADIRDDRAVGTVFSGVLAHKAAVVGIGEDSASRRAFVAAVSSNYFRTLEVPLVRGRDFSPEEEQPRSAAAVVIVSHLYWKKTGFDPHLVGKTLRVNERPFTIIGIAPEHFSGTGMLFGPEFYFPFGASDMIAATPQAQAARTLERRDAYDLYVVGRLRPGTTATAAGAVLRSVAANLEQQFPVEQQNQSFLVRPLPRTRTSTYPTDERDLTVIATALFALSTTVLLIACLNLANMLLARGLARRKEVAIRLAVGGGRGRIVRQLLTEGFVLSLAGGVGGFLIGLVSIDLLMASLAAHMPVPMFVGRGTDPTVLMATLAFCAVATLLFSLGPALKLTRAELVTDLKEQAGEDRAPHRVRWLPRNPLVAAQIALSLGLLTAAGLLIRGALEAGSVETGFKADATILVEVDASLGGYDRTRSLALYRAAGDRLSALPGVAAASVSATVPFGSLTINRPVQRAGASPAPDSRPATAAEGLAFNARWNGVGADYFTTMGVPLLRGRAFTKTEAESADAPPVAIIDEPLAKKLWPDGDALGQRIQWADRGAPTAAGGGSGTMGTSNDVARRDQDPRAVEIVGIAPATRWELADSGLGGCIFVPFAQDAQSNAFLQVRPAADATGYDAAMFERLRREVRSAAPGVPVLAVKTFRQHLDGNALLWVMRAGAGMVSIFAGLALALAVVGAYGVMTYAVARRTREIGIRMSLGAEPGKILRMILGEGAVMALGGAVPGFLLALAIGRALSSLLYHVSPGDPVVLMAAPTVLAATALLACYLPARRAAKLDPMVALRCA
jgi:predicted permease